MANQVIVYRYTGNMQTIELPSGEYILECWGAGGGQRTTAPLSSVGIGGYAKGTIIVTDLLTLYLYVGGKGTDYDMSPNGKSLNGGWNGGGGNNQPPGVGLNDNSVGGGATDFCTVDSAVTLDGFRRWIRTSNSYNSRIIVAGGGGGGRSNNAAQHGGTTAGGVGGRDNGPGVNGGSILTVNYSPPGFGWGATSGGTGSDDDDPAGGAGWYGGAIQRDSYGGGGSSYVLGSGTFRPSGYIHAAGSPFEMTDRQMIAGNLSMPNPSGPGNISTGLTGNGMARITRLNVPPSTGGLYVLVMGA